MPLTDRELLMAIVRATRDVNANDPERAAAAVAAVRTILGDAQNAERAERVGRDRLARTGRDRSE